VDGSYRGSIIDRLENNKILREIDLILLDQVMEMRFYSPEGFLHLTLLYSSVTI
jgi:hypothetical protein